MAKKEKDEVMGHDFDGIEEFDNDLPPWWLNLFYVTIAFAVVYFSYYHVIGKGPDQHAQYEEELAAAEALQKENGGSDRAVNLVAYKDAENLRKGSEVFNTYCMACHGAKAQGDVGPNLTDEYWLHGEKFSNIVNTITKGVPDKGMVTWEGVLKPEEIVTVASYVVSLQGSRPEGAKEPQGEKHDAATVGR